jgi:acetylornithine/N-succinyldiaminopimelate aminotransferase
MNQRQLFLQHVGQTSTQPLCLNIVRAQGNRLYDVDGKSYLDLIAGISVCNIGHSHPRVVSAIQEQAARYTHVMVYGEFIESPQVQYATKLASLLPENLNSVFFTASGSEATEGAMKLAKRFTGRAKMISFKNSYHGSTQGALSVMGSEYWQQAFRPLLPGIYQGIYNDPSVLEKIDADTACVIVETIQAEAGVNLPTHEWMQSLRKRCSETGTLLILDEIQCGFGRNGTLWAFEQFGIVPDILLLGKALGGGMPLGAFVSDKHIMDSLSHQPVLGHINTFGGHPVSCAAGLAALETLLEEKYLDLVFEKATHFVQRLKHPEIEKVNHRGLMIAVHFSSADKNKAIIDALLEKGVFTDWFLFAPQALRIAPPLTISSDEIDEACDAILEVLNANSN